jgi:hypothetical protein
VYPIFEKQFPGFVSANQELTKAGLPAVSVSQYQQYETTAFAAARAAGLPDGFLNKDNIGTLIGGNVSTTELSARFTDAVNLAYNSTPAQQAQFNQYFGTGYNLDHGGPTNGAVTTGQIAALLLNPNTAEPLIHQQITAAQIGGAGVTAGVGAISAPEALKLAQAGVSGQVSFSQIAPLAPLETALPGQVTNAGQNTLTPDQLVGAQLLPDATTTRQLEVAQESRKAPFTGGGGVVSTSGGAVGAGSAGPVNKQGQ